MRCTYLFAILTAACVVTSCKPRSDQSQALSDQDASGTVTIDRSAVKTIVDDATHGKTDMDDLGEFAKANKNFRFDQRQFASQVVVQLAKTVESDRLILQLASKYGADTTDTASAPRQDVEKVMAVYTQILKTLEPINSMTFWANWSDKKAEEVGVRCDAASAAFGKVAAVAVTWKPKDAAIAPRPLAELPPVLQQVPQPVVQNPGPTPEPAKKVPPTPAGAVNNGNNGNNGDIEWVDNGESGGQQQQQQQPTPKQGGGKGGAVANIPVVEPQPVKDLWLEAKRRVEALEKDLVDGRFAGQVPSLNQLRGAVESSRKSKPRPCQDGRPNSSSVCAGQELIDLLSGISQIKELYAEDAGVDEGYTIRQHTERVLAYFFNQSEAYGLPQGSNDYNFLMPVVMALHDIGKPVAVRGGNKEKQHEHNSAIVFAVLQKVGFSYTQANIGQVVAGADVLGYVVRSNSDPYDAKSVLKRYAEVAKISVQEYFNLSRPFYLSDACSYPGVRNSYFSRDNGGSRLMSNNGALERLASVINPQPVVQKPVEKAPPIPAEVDQGDPFAQQGPQQGQVGQQGKGQQGQGQQGQPVQVAVFQQQQPENWAGPFGKNSPPKKQQGLSPKSFIGSKYSTFTIGVSFYGDRVAHMYGEGQGDKWWDATWELDQQGRIIVQLKDEGSVQPYVFDARDVMKLVLLANGDGLVVPRVRAPN